MFVRNSIKSKGMTISTIIRRPFSFPCNKDIYIHTYIHTYIHDLLVISLHKQYAHKSTSLYILLIIYVFIDKILIAHNGGRWKYTKWRPEGAHLKTNELFKFFSSIFFFFIINLLIIIIIFLNVNEEKKKKVFNYE